MEKQTFRSGYIAIIGRPNVGKSTMMNRIIGQKIAITSNKPQTTRNRIQTVYTDERGQMIFLDTPGINRAKNKLGDYMLNTASIVLNKKALIVILINVVFYLLSILVLNLFRFSFVLLSCIEPIPA